MGRVYYRFRNNMDLIRAAGEGAVTQEGSLHQAAAVPLHGGGAAPVQLAGCGCEVHSVGQSTMFGWDGTEGQPEASWNEFSGLYRAFLKSVTLSEVDHEERPVCYTCVPSRELTPDSTLGFDPIIFLSCYFLQSPKGMLVCYSRLDSEI